MASRLQGKIEDPVPALPLRVVKPRNQAMEMVEDILYGSVAGGLGKYIEYPFDTVKVRLQSQPDGAALRYKGPLDCFQKSIQADGVRGLYRGISAPVVGAAIETSCLFFFDSIGSELLHHSGIVPQGQVADKPWYAFWMSGAFSGALTSFFLTPVELVKCKIQVPETEAGVVKAPLKPLPVIRDIMRYQGLRGFWHGQMGTLIRETGGCAAWFGGRASASKVFMELNLRKASSAEERERIKASPLPLWQQAAAGASGGVLYNFLFFPADTVKSRMQTTPIGESTANRTFMSESRALWKEAGVKGFYRGCGITVARSAPSSAFIFVVFDYLKTHLKLG